jgi:phosphatidylinositol alpha-1,6-mannosyltransferase
MSSRSHRPRLLVITPDFPPARGGIQVLVHRLAAGLQGFETKVVALDCEGAGPFDAGSALATRRVRAGGRAGAARNVVLNLAALREAIGFRPHVTLSAHIVASPAAACVRRALAAPTVQYFHAKEIGGRPRLAAFAAREADVAIAVSAYTARLIGQTGVANVQMRLIPPGVDLPSSAAGAEQPAFRAGTGSASAPPRVDLPSSAAGAEQPAVRAGTGSASAPPRVDLPSAADAHATPPPVSAVQPPDPRPRERPRFVTISRLDDRYKGHDVLIHALALVRARVPDVEWVVIGDGPLRKGLEALARSAGVADSVRFLGAVSDERRDRWLRRADLLAMPSRLPGGGLAGEGFGIVYLEAAAHGKPVVAGNVAGALDAVADGESGLLVDPTDSRAVAGAIATLLLDRELAQRLGRAGAARARGFAWPVIAGRVEAVLLEQLQGSPRSSHRPRPRLALRPDLPRRRGRGDRARTVA